MCLLLAELLQLSLILFGLVCLCELELELVKPSDDFDLRSCDDLRDDFCESFGVELRRDDGLRCRDDDFLRSTNAHTHTYTNITCNGIFVVFVVVMSK